MSFVPQPTEGAGTERRARDVLPSQIFNIIIILIMYFSSLLLPIFKWLTLFFYSLGAALLGTGKHKHTGNFLNCIVFSCYQLLWCSGEEGQQAHRSAARNC